MLVFPSKKIKRRQMLMSVPLLEMRHVSQIRGSLKEKHHVKKNISQWIMLVLEQDITVNMHEWHESNYTQQ